MKSKPEYSVIVTVGTRVDDLREIVAELVGTLDAQSLDYEVVVVLDGPMQSCLEELREIRSGTGCVRIVELARRFGESGALAAGFSESSGETIVTWPAYRQVETGEIPRLIEAFDSSGCDMQIAVRQRDGGSFDSFRRRAFHAMFRLTSGMRFRDLGCGVRIFDREVAKEISLYGDQHRFLPALAKTRGFRVREIDVAQSPADRFEGRYRLREYLHRFLDILTVYFLVRFTKKPLRFFGTIGFLVAAFGGLFTAILVVQRLFMDVALASRPALVLASLLVVLGVQIFALGLIGELIIFTHATHLKEYAVRRVIENGVPVSRQCDASHNSDHETVPESDN
ncbi:MAG: glycosyltransferase [Proteobacteria bacterium]|nr:glycosyltransferase [Pseudomonadota bacterium]